MIKDRKSEFNEMINDLYLFNALKILKQLFIINFYVIIFDYPCYLNVIPLYIFISN